MPLYKLYQSFIHDYLHFCCIKAVKVFTFCSLIDYLFSVIYHGVTLNIEV